MIDTFISRWADLSRIGEDGLDCVALWGANANADWKRYDAS